MDSNVLALFGPIGNWEIVLIAAVALVLFANRIPAAMRSIGRAGSSRAKGRSPSSRRAASSITSWSG